MRRTPRWPIERSASTPSPWARSGLGLGLLALAGCYRGGSEPAGMETDSDGEATDAGDEGEDSPFDDDDLACAGAGRSSFPLRRLTPQEYARTVAMIFGVDGAPYVEQFPDEGASGGFRNQVELQGMTLAHVTQYQAAAEAIAADVFADPGLRGALVSCDLAEAPCLEGLVARLGRLAHRRPLDDGQVEALRDLAIELGGADALDRGRVVVEALLQSSAFLYRVEAGAGPAGIPGYLALDPYELATRLAFTITGRGPDDALLDAAAAGELDDAAGVVAAAEALMATDAARDNMRDFAHQWFRLSSVEGASFDPATLPDFTPALAAAAAEEVLVLFEDLAAEGRPLTDLYRAEYGYANADLGALYGVSVSGESLQRVELADDPRRGGLFGTAAFAMATSDYAGTNVVARGLLVRSATLCETPPAPPPGVVPTEPEPGETPAQTQRRHSEDPACAPCHQQFDPIGFGLENYSPLGAWREVDEAGDPVDGQGALLGVGTEAFTGARELGELVAASDQARACAVETYFRFAFGRAPEPADACSLASIAEVVTDEGGAYDSVVRSTVAHPLFMVRSDEGSE
ncbi:MAG: DUF1592 domain-containing protein [Myxococcales bacterium]|nr:DUF1592 domain-containing protein [Myxococcales bacterium]